MKILLKFECDDQDDIDQVLMVIDEADDVDCARKEAKAVLGDCILTASVVLDFGHNKSWASPSDFADQYRPFSG